MRGIQVTAWEKPPKFSDTVPEPVPPTLDDKVLLKVVASGLPQLVRLQSAGLHYSSKAAGLPYTPGADGVGLTPDGKLVYFNSIGGGGGFAERIVIPKVVTFPVPIPESIASNDEEVHKLAINIAGLGNPAMASWMALRTRVAHLPEKFTVLILGVTTLSGQVAVPIARYLGAGKVIGVARTLAAMQKLDLDERVVLAEDPTATDYGSLLDSVDVILDFLYGPPASHILAALPTNTLTARPVTFVQIGSVAGSTISLDAFLPRSKNLTIVGSGPGSWSIPQLSRETVTMVKMLAETIGSSEFTPLTIRKLEDVDEAYADKKGRTVFVPEP